MLRPYTLIVCFLISLLGVIVSDSAAAQSYPQVPTRITLSSASRTLRVGEKTDIVIKLLDQQSRDIAATYDTEISLIATRLKDIDSAKGDVQGSLTLQEGAFELPAGRNTVRVSITVQRGQSGRVVRFSSQQSGTIRVFAESEKLVTGSTLIAVVGKNTAMKTGVFRPVLFQDQASAQLRLAIETDGTDIPPLVNGEWVRNLNVLLVTGEEPMPADENIKVVLKIEDGSANLPVKEVTIHQGEVMSDRAVELRTRTGGDIKVSAAAVRGHRPVSPALTTIKFPVVRRATKLLVDAIPTTALANGLEEIKIQVRAADDGNNPISGEDEGLEARRVVFHLEGRTLGLQFDKGLTEASIPKNSETTEVRIFGSCPVAGTKVVAESENSIGNAIRGVAAIEFCFPWMQLGFAMLGGLVVSVAHRSLLSKQHRKTGGVLARLSLEGFAGALIGGLFFGFIFFGAVMMSELNWSGVPIVLARLPVSNAFAACLIGFAGGVLVNLRSFLKESIVSKVKSVRQSLSP